MKKSHHTLWSTGSTIIEVLIATTLVAFSLTGLAMLMTNNVKNSAEADYREASAGIAQDTMEKIMQLKTTTSWASFRSNPYSSSPECNITSGTDMITKYKTTFYVKCTHIPIAATGNDKTITVKVCWPGDCGATDKSSTIVKQFYNY